MYLPSHSNINIYSCMPLQACPAEYQALGYYLVVNVDDVAESAELVCDTILFNPIDNVATITSSPVHGGTNNKHGTCLTLHVWNNIASTPQHRGTNGKHDASPALPV